MKGFRKLSIAATAVTLLLITVGALVRATGSGLGCPDWPKCYGSWVPPLRAASIIEYSHRLTASLLGVLVLWLAIQAWLKFRSVKPIFWPAFLSLVTVLIQAGIGRSVVLGELPRGLVALHFFTSLTVLGLLVLTSANAINPRGGRFDKVALHGVVALIAAFIVLMVGAFVSQYQAALAFVDWPLMDGSLSPPQGGLKLVHYAHRVLAGLLGITLGHYVYRVERLEVPDAPLKKLVRACFALWFIQVVLGAANVFTRSAEWAIVAHVLAAALLWSALVAAAVRAYRRPRENHGAADTRVSVDTQEVEVPASSMGDVAKAYFMLTKPRIIELLLITTVPAMVLATRGWPGGWLVLATLIGGSLTAGSANAINCYVDRDIDEMMARTSTRPLPAHQIEPNRALIFGILLGVAGYVWLAVTVNVPAALLATSAIVFYVFIYTLWMKRRTPSNIVIGGAAGAVPVLVGWAAVTGTLSRSAWVLFAIIFYWTPPHFWALALKYSDDYSAAGVPMLPVVQGRRRTTDQMFLYSVVLLAVSLLLVPVAHLGYPYLITAVVLGVGLTAYSLRLRADPTDIKAMRMFHFSITYLVILFVAVAVDRLIDAATPVVLYRPLMVAAWSTFVVFELAILISVLGYKRTHEGRWRAAAGELLWTAVPLVVVSALFLLSWQTGSLAAP